MSGAAIVLLLALQDPAGDAMDRVLRTLRDKVAPSVVTIDVVRTADPEGRTGSGGSSAHLDYYNRPAGPVSGTILTADGYILTSGFNVSGEIRRVTVTLPGGRALEAKLLGQDETRDVALLKIDATGLPVLPKAKPDEARQGDYVAVVGRSPDPSVPTISQGILSATGRMKGSAVQMDAELNYGNVGGPLVNLRGELIGVTSHIRPRQPWGQSSGVGFATKTSEIDRIFEDLKKSKGATAKKGAWLGVLLADSDPAGVRVAQVVPNSPAEEAGIEEGDLVLSVDGKPVAKNEELQAMMEERKPGDGVELRVRRRVKDKDEIKTLKAKLEKGPN